MSVDYTAYALFGVRLSLHHLVQRTIVPNCPHHPPEGARFCPICGAKAGSSKKEDASRLYDAIGDWLDDGPPKPLTFVEIEGGIFHLGIGLEALADEDGAQSMPIGELPAREEIEKTVKDALEPKGLWSDAVAGTLGLHLVVVGR